MIVSAASEPQIENWRSLAGITDTLKNRQTACNQAIYDNKKPPIGKMSLYQ
jgi:hypothetical protein